MNYLVLGAGMMGSAAAYDLARSDPRNRVCLADIDPAAATRSAHAIGSAVAPMQLDVNDARALRRALADVAAVISAVSYSVNERVTEAAIDAGVHMCDLGGNNDVVARQIARHDAAQRRGVTVVPNCGLAPGLINVLAVTGAGEFDELESILLRVGGLPQHPRPPLNYQIVFSAEGLLNEYIEKSEAIRDGRRVLVDGMGDLEDIEFPPPYGTLEAFNTSGGVSTLPALFEGRVHTLNYKTIRYRGHCEKFRTLLDLGFASSEPILVGDSVKTSRVFFTELLKRKLSFNDKDVVLARATITGRRQGRHCTLAYELIDSYDEATQMTAMMRTTAFPTSIIAQMLADGTITRRGVLPPEACVPGDRMIRELERRAIRITSHLSER